MAMNPRALCLLVVVLAGGVTASDVRAQAAIAPDLADTLATADEKDLIPVLIVFAERRVFTAQELAAIAAWPKNERQSYVAAEIMDFATTQQGNVTGLLENAEGEEAADSVRPLEGAYAVAVRATPAVIEEVAEQPEVAAIYLDEFIPPDEMLDVDHARTPTATAPITAIRPPEIAWGVEAVQAPLLWTVALCTCGRDGQRL
jgi:hypothetical protein